MYESYDNNMDMIPEFNEAQYKKNNYTHACQVHARDFSLALHWGEGDLFKTIRVAPNPGKHFYLFEA